MSWFLFKVKIEKNLPAVSVKVINNVLNGISRFFSPLQQNLFAPYPFPSDFTNCMNSGGLPTATVCCSLPEDYFEDLEGQKCLRNTILTPEALKL